MSLSFYWRHVSPIKRNKALSHHNICCGCSQRLKSGWKTVPVGEFKQRVNEQTHETEAHRLGRGAVGGVVLPGGERQGSLIELQRQRAPERVQRSL